MVEEIGANFFTVTSWLLVNHFTPSESLVSKIAFQIASVSLKAISGDFEKQLHVRPIRLLTPPASMPLTING